MVKSTYLRWAGVFIALLLNGCGGQSPSSSSNHSVDHSPPTQSSYQFTAVSELPLQPQMPDPLTLYDGAEVLTESDWQVRRQEMIQILEDYQYGHMPPPPGNVTAQILSSTNNRITNNGTSYDYRNLRLSFGPNESLSFELGMFVPTAGNGATAEPYPALINLTFGVSEASLGSAEMALSRGYAVVSVPYQQLGADAPNYASTAFFPAYPNYDWRDFSAWAWGLSRAVDYLITDPVIDSNKLIITGVSRLGQAVLVAGAFDERIAMSAPVAGGMAFRFSGREMGNGLGQGITEIVDQNTYWFGPLFEQFRNQTPRLPSDQHWLLALTAPRLMILCNALEDPYGRAYAAAQTYVHARPVYEFLGAEQNLGIHFRPGGHGATAADWTAIMDFADQQLLNLDHGRRFDQLPPENLLP